MRSDFAGFPRWPVASYVPAFESFPAKKSVNWFEYVQYSTDSCSQKPHDGFAKRQTGKKDTETEPE
jgi:hypothetical protein